MEKCFIPKQEAYRQVAEVSRIEIMDLLESVAPKRQDIAHFIPYEKGYYAILKNGERLDIVHVKSFQPHIESFEDYFSYLLVETLDSFYILRQRVLENRTLPWHTILELKPRQPSTFFRTACGQPAFLEALIIDIE